MRVEETNKMDVAEMNFLRSMYGVTRWIRWRNEEVRDRVGVPESLSRRAYRKLLKWFGHVERMGGERLTIRVYMSDVKRKKGVRESTF